MFSIITSTIFNPKSGAWAAIGVVAGGQLHKEPGTLWKSPELRALGIIVVIALLIWHAPNARAGGGPITSDARGERRVQDTQHIHATVDGIAKVETVQASVGAMVPVPKAPRDYLAEGDFPYLQKLAASGKTLPQDQWMLLLGLNQKRPDRFQLLSLYMDHGLDIRQSMPVLSDVVLGSRIRDIPTRRNLKKLDTWATKRTQVLSIGLAFLCERMDLLAYAYISEDELLSDWLMNRGANPRQEYPCDYIDKPMTSEDLKTLLLP